MRPENLTDPDLQPRGEPLEFVPLGVFGRDEDTGGAALTLPMTPPAARSAVASCSGLPPSPKLEKRAGVI